jgi:uncharacterized protein (DUF4415 family)
MRKPSKQPYSQEDWDEVSDNPELTEADFKRARPGHEVFPGLAEAVARRRGRPKSGSPKVQINLRIDPDVLDAYRAGGAGWQTRMNAVLRAGLPAGAAGAVEPPKRSRPEAASAATAGRGRRSAPKRVYS